MKNIHSLISEALSQAKLVDSDFTKKVEGFYKITLTKSDHPGKMFIYMDVKEDTIEHIQYFNTLLSQQLFLEFTQAFNRNIQQ